MSLSSISDCFGKKYELNSSVNFDEYMKAVGKFIIFFSFYRILLFNIRLSKAPD